VRFGLTVGIDEAELAAVAFVARHRDTYERDLLGVVSSCVRGATRTPGSRVSFWGSYPRTARALSRSSLRTRVVASMSSTGKSTQI